MSDQIVGILSLGNGNISSLRHVLERLDLDILEISDHDQLSLVSVLILPGVGAFNSYMNVLHEKEFILPIKNFVKCRENKLIGICVGMQVLFTDGWENYHTKGLNLFPGTVVKNKMGLNIGYRGMDLKGFLGFKEYGNCNFYFTHGYSVQTKAELEFQKYIVNKDFSYLAMFKDKNVYGMQFHPELSGKNGIDFLKQIIYEEKPINY